MPNLSFTDVQSFHAQLLAVEKSGLPMHLGLGNSSESLSSTLWLVTSQLTTEVNQGKSLSDAVGGLPLLSPAYKTALWTWYYCDHSPAALESVTAKALAQKTVSRCYQASLVHPLVLLVLSYLAMIYLSTFLIPKFESLNTQLNKQPGPTLALLLVLREAMPIWVPLVPLLGLAASVGWYRRQKKSNARALPGSRDYLSKIGNASYAERVADLLAHNLPLAQALSLADTGLSNGKPLVEPLSTEQPATEQSATEQPSTEQPSSSMKALRARSSPLLNWAIDSTSEESNATEWSLLKFLFVGHSYRRLAELQVQRLSSWLPALMAIGVGGLVVSLVGLTVFLPLIEFMLYVAGGH